MDNTSKVPAVDKRLKMPDWMAQFVMKFTWNGQQCRNVIYLRKEVFAIAVPTNEWVNETWVGEDVVTDANNVMESYITHVMPIAVSQCTLDGIHVTSCEAVDTGPLHEWDSTASSSPGTNGSLSLPNNVTVAMKLGTGLGGRSNHGRVFFVGAGDGLVDSPNWNNLKPGSQLDLVNGFNDWLADINQEPGIPLIGDKRNRLLVASFIHGGLVRTPAVGNNCTGFSLTDSILDSQRRRLPGRGL